MNPGHETPLASSSVRRSAIIRLLETRDDNLPTMSRRDHSPSGFVHGQPGQVSCPDCLANDRVMFGCESCGGRGTIDEPRRLDPYAVQEVQPFGLDGTYLERDRERVAQIARLESQTAPPRSEADLLAEANDHPYGWEIARRRMYEQFDYGALDREIELLREVDEGTARALSACFVYGWAEPSAGYEAAVERGLRFLHRRLPDPLRAPPPPRDDAGKPLIVGRLERGAGASARELRDNEIRKMAAAGARPEDLAKRYLLGIRSIYNIVSHVA